MCVRLYYLTRASHASAVPDDSLLSGSSMFRSEKSGFRPFCSEDPSCAIINSPMGVRPAADDSLNIVMEADLAAGTERTEAQFKQYLTDKLRAWKRTQMERFTRERDELEDMRVANSVAYANDLKELRIGRTEAPEELRLHQVFMERQQLAIQEEQVRLSQQLARSAQLEAELSERDTRLTAQERRLEEALEALRLEKRAFQAEREAYNNAAQVCMLVGHVIKLTYALIFLSKGWIGTKHMSYLHQAFRRADNFQLRRGI